MKTIIFLVFLFVWYKTTKKIVFWESVVRLGLIEKAPEMFILHPKKYIYFSYALWVINFIFLLHLPYKILSIPIFLIISISLAIKGRIEAQKIKDDEIQEFLNK